MYKCTDGDGNHHQLERVSYFVDLGVGFDCELSFAEHMNSKICKANQMLGIINRAFINMNKDCFLILYKLLVRTHLEYAHSVWSPYRQGLINDLESVQRRATKLVPQSNVKYIQRLKFLELPTLKFRRLRGDMIEVFKIITGVYDSSVAPVLPVVQNSITRGNSLKLRVDRCRYDLREYSFCNRIVNIWNSLPESVVSSDSVNQFKNRLDDHWANDDLMYDPKYDYKTIQLIELPVIYL